MRNLILLPFFVLAACHSPVGADSDAATASGSGERRSYDVGSFDSVALGGFHNVVIKVGGAPSVRAEGPADVLDHLEIRVERNVLSIGSKDNWSWHGNRHPATVYVTMPTLTNAAIGGSGDMDIDTVSGSRFDASIGGSGNMAIGQLKVGTASFSIAGSGNMRAAGSADTVKVSVVGSGDVDAGALASRTASVSIAGSGDAVVRATGTADAAVMGSGDITIQGGAKCSVSKMGSGDVRCG